MGFPLSIIYDLPWQANTWKLFAAQAEECISSKKKKIKCRATAIMSSEKKPNINVLCLKYRTSAYPMDIMAKLRKVSLKIL